MSPQASDHTILVNSVIAMLTPNQGWPSPLSDMGYKLRMIEGVFNIGTQGRNPCNPDVISVNEPNSNVMLLECKGGKNVKQKQLERYLLVSPDDLEKLITVENPSALSTNIVYVCRRIDDFKKSMSLTLQKIRKEGNVGKIPDDIDIMEVARSKIKIHTTNSNKWSIEFIAGIPISEGTLPHSFYPFSEDDNPEYILGEVVRSIIHIYLKSSLTPNEVVITVDEVVQDVFDIYAYISQTQIRILKKSVNLCFTKIIKETALKGKISRLGPKGKPISIKRIQGVVEGLEKIAREIEEGLSQTALDDFF